MGSKRSRVHPKHKMKYAVANWPAYERALVRRGDITFWLSPSVVSAWRARPSGKRGAQPMFTDLAIETALALRLVLGLPLRQTEGFLRGLFALLDVDLGAPDHTTLSRRARALGTKLLVIRPAGPIHLVLDSTGLAIHGEGDCTEKQCLYYKILSFVAVMFRSSYWKKRCKDYQQSSKAIMPVEFRKEDTVQANHQNEKF